MVLKNAISTLSSNCKMKLCNSMHGFIHSIHLKQMRNSNGNLM